MKNYKTFLSEQQVLNEVGGTNTLGGGGPDDRSGGIASISGEKILVPTPDHAKFVKNFKAVYAFDGFLKGFESLTHYTIRPEEAKAYKETLKQLLDSDPIKYSGIAQELDNLQKLPASKDKTYKSHQIVFHVMMFNQQIIHRDLMENGTTINE